MHNKIKTERERERERKHAVFDVWLNKIFFLLKCKYIYICEITDSVMMEK